MSPSAAGVDTFLVDHPTYDGRGVVVLIFDTGIDMSIPGLQKTSTGDQKVIDAIDFSRSNVVQFRKASGSGASGYTAPGAGFRVRGISALIPPPTSNDEVYIGAINESNYRNSSVRDFDGDGDANSNIAAVLYRADDTWRVALDTDGDSTMAGEHGIASYREHYETLQLKQQSGGKSPLTFAAAIEPGSHTVAFHYDMGGHGTHVAGIAAGFGINREQGFNGIAPGAQLISCKFSGDTAKDNTVTGSMRRAYEYAAHVSDSLAEYHRPVVVNMSFGIGAALEGRADIERFLDTLIPNHPNLYVVTSAGNEGPGLSSVGIPASSPRMITVGAALPQGIGRDGYNAALDRDIIWDFSSRGGEVDKPDVIAPGTAVSTIPRYAFQSRESGTSMASPYTAGVVALLLSAMKQEDSTWMPTQELMRRALRNSATILQDYPLIEQGGGMLNVRRAYDLLRSYRRSGFADDLQLYTISTFSPNYPDGHGPTAFWRSAYVPDADWRQSFTISRYVPRMKEASDDEFFRAYTLEATAPWLRPIQSTVYIRGRDVATVDVMYDRDRMREPGLYSGRIIARRASGHGPASDQEHEFELINTVIVPYTFSPEKDYTVTTQPQKLAAGVTRRFYFAPPVGAAAITFTLSVPKGSRSNVSGKIADRKGVTANYLPHAHGTERSEASNTIPMSALGDGVIEVVVQAEAFEGGGGESEFTLSASALMMSVTPTVERSAGPPSLHVEVENNGTTPIRGDFNYTIKGFGRTFLDTLHSDFASIPLVMRKGDGALWVRPRFADEDYMHATDILVQIVDADGNVQAQEPLNTPSTWLFLPNFNHESDSTKLWLQVNFGAAHYEHFGAIPIEVTENHMRPSDPHSIGGMVSSEIFPSIPRSVTARLSSTIQTPPGYHQIGEVGFKPRGSDQTIPFEFTFTLP
ncbi:MAG TPA: S8 family serine peptidase [Candidatus Kapabacteria bacterium]|nr:S8 family serine peptidase [Candidatus Kapabacteria bacterium]